MQLSRLLLIAVSLLLGAFLVSDVQAQVHYHADGNPWKQRASSGPDAVVDGWYYQLGVTGIRVQLLPERPTGLLVKHVFQGSPAEEVVEVGDWILGAGGKRFVTAHRNGYGPDRFGAHGPIADFAAALDLHMQPPEGARSPLPKPGGKGRLPLMLLRADKELRVTLDLVGSGRAFGPKFPLQCSTSEGVREALLDYLVAAQLESGSWGSPPRDTFAPLALLASGKPEHLEAVKKNVAWHARSTKSVDESWLINWRYMSAGIVLSEYLLATGDAAVLPELQEVYEFLIGSQYTDLAQRSEKVKETHPHSWPEDAMDSHGGWGHNPGFEGYGPIAMLTGQGAIALSLMQRAGILVDPKRHRSAYAFLGRATGANGYTWYEDSLGGEATDYADMGRTGASAVAHRLSPWKEHEEVAKRQGACIARHPEPYPDTHGSPLMGMGYAALGAFAAGEKPFAALMRANRWWFTLARCGDGTFAYQPNRDNAGYGADSRLAASAVTAFLLSIPKGNLAITGKRFPAQAQETK